MTYLETLKQSAEAIGLTLSDEALKQKSSVLPIRAVISFFWNRKGSGPMKSMSRA